MIIDINLIYRIVLNKKVKLSDEFVENRARVKVGLIDDIITTYKEHGGYYSERDGKLIDRLVMFLAEYTNEQSNN